MMLTGAVEASAMASRRESSVGAERRLMKKLCARVRGEGGVGEQK